MAIGSNSNRDKHSDVLDFSAPAVLEPDPIEIDIDMLALTVTSPPRFNAFEDLLLRITVAYKIRRIEIPALCPPLSMVILESHRFCSP